MQLTVQFVMRKQLALIPKDLTGDFLLLLYYKIFDF